MNSDANQPTDTASKQVRTYASSNLTPRQWRTRLLVAVISILLLAVAPLLGYYAVFVRPTADIVIQVNEVTYTRGDVLERLRFKLYEATQAQASPIVNPLIAVREVLDEELIRQAAVERGLTLSAHDVDEAIWHEVMGDIRPARTGARLQREFDERYRQFILARDISQELHRRIAEIRLYTEALRAQLTSEIPETVPQVLLARLAVADRNEANEIRQRVTEGERFVDIVTAVGGSRAASAGVEWTPRMLLDDAVAGAIEQLPPGELSKPVPNPSGGLSLYAALETADARPPEPHQLGLMQRTAFDRWLAEEETRQNVRYELDSKTYQWLIEQLRASHVP